MAKKESVKIETIAGDSENSTIYIMSLNISGLDLYESAKAKRKFINNDTKVLEMVLETDLRHILKLNGIIPQDGSESSLEKAFALLEIKGKSIEIRDRYCEIGNEKIIGESANHMTVIQEGNILSCAMEVIVNERETL